MFWLSHRDRMEPLPPPELGLDVETDNVTHALQWYEKIYYT